MDENVAAEPVEELGVVQEDEEGEEQEEEACQGVNDLMKQLDQIQVHVPVTFEEIDLKDLGITEFPESYKENDDKEKLIVEYAENFRRQFVHLYRDRKPLFLCPLNECGIEKFVCSTIRPTLLSYKDVWNYDGAADFVSDYLSFQALEPPTELPGRLYSPNTTLKRQKGNSFDFSTLLCSLLIGAGYDAYVICGYASRETCHMDETRELCPLLVVQAAVREEETKKDSKKYAVRPARDLRSKFEMKQNAQRRKEEQEAEEKHRQEELERIAELEKPPPDPLHGLRVHSWVLILSGKREVPEPFYIESLTGHSFPTTHGNYLGIESLWNQQNYWVNMQDCRNGCRDLVFDLGDCSKWEFMLPQTEQAQLQIPEEEENFDFEDEEKEEQVEEREVELAPSWVEAIDVSAQDFELRCPMGKKTLLYKKAKLEKFAPYISKDGLIQRLGIYDDNAFTKILSSKEWYKNRVDKLDERHHDHVKGLVTAYFTEGRQRSMKEHQYSLSSTGIPETNRTMIFYHEARVDGLSRRNETPMEMVENYVNRSDFLFYRKVVYGKRMKKFGPADANSNRRPILEISEKFHRNTDKTADFDVAEIVYNLSEEKINLTYHCDQSKIAASTREFVKPPNLEDKNSQPPMTSDLHSEFQVDYMAKPPKNLFVYEIFLELLKSEEKSISVVRFSEDETSEILMDRSQEEASSELDISVYDTQRNEKAKKQRRALERLEMEEKMRRDEMELDYLAPFLAQIGTPDKLTRQQAYKLKEDCLADLKQRLVDKANLIQARFEKETQDLQKKQQWYQQNQISMQKEDEEEYLNYCSEAMFRIHILELRLNRHKEIAPHRYMALEQKLRTDQRLTEFF